jgi:hypothetical protein
MDGMDPKYANNPWIEHGEYLPIAADPNLPEHSETQSDFNLPGPLAPQADSNVQDMLHDVFGMYEDEDNTLEPTVPTEGPSFLHGLTPDVQRFYQLLKDADTKL